MVEQNSARCVEIEALAIVDSDPVTEELCYAVRTARVEGRRLVLALGLNFAEHLAGRGLIEPDLRIGQPQRLERDGHGQRRRVRREQWLVPRGSDKTLRSKVVVFIRLRRVDHPNDRGQIRDIRIGEIHVLPYAKFREAPSGVGCASR